MPFAQKTSTWGAMSWQASCQGANSTILTQLSLTLIQYLEDGKVEAKTMQQHTSICPHVQTFSPNT